MKRLLIMAAIALACVSGQDDIEYDIDDEDNALEVPDEIVTAEEAQPEVDTSYLEFANDDSVFDSEAGKFVSSTC